VADADADAVAVCDAKRGTQQTVLAL